MNVGKAFDLPSPGRGLGCLAAGAAAAAGAWYSGHVDAGAGAVAVQALGAGWFLRTALLVAAVYLHAHRWQRARDRWLAAPGNGQAPRLPEPVRPRLDQLKAAAGLLICIAGCTIIAVIHETNPWAALVLALITGATAREGKALWDAITARRGHPVVHAHPVRRVRRA